jgi:hypothetical protein
VYAVLILSVRRADVWRVAFSDTLWASTRQQVP